MSYDTKCYELAEHFIDDPKQLSRISDLAQHIQDSIEDFLNDPNLWQDDAGKGGGGHGNRE